MDLFQLGDFTLNSGAKSSWKIECDAFSDGDWQALAKMISEMVGPFQSVEGVPRGGLKLAQYLKPFRVEDGVHLIMDDVLTTGGSMAFMRQKELDTRYYTQNGATIAGAVVFARGPCPAWIVPLFQMPPALWLPDTSRILGKSRP
jgi:orotate phosphoribosyltransferase